MQDCEFDIDTCDDPTSPVGLIQGEAELVALTETATVERMAALGCTMNSSQPSESTL